MVDPTTAITIIVKTPSHTLLANLHPLRLLGGSKQNTRQTPSSKMALLSFAMPILLLFPVVLLAPKLKPRRDFHQCQQYRTYISSRIGSTYAPFPTATIGVVSSTP